MTRFIVFFIAGYIIYYLIKNRFKDKHAGNGVQYHTGKKSDTNPTHLKEIAYIFYSATKDANTCEACMELDGKHILPNHKILQQIRPPHSRCKNPKGCRCTLVYVTRDEDDSDEIEALLKKRGGMCDQRTIDKR